MMDPKTRGRWAGGALIFAAVAVAARLGLESSGAAGTAWSLLPPVVAIGLAVIMQNVYLSLSLAVILGGTLVAGGSLLAGLGTAGAIVGEVLHPRGDAGGLAENWWILGFVFLIFAVVEVLIASGGFRGVIRWLLHLVRGRRSAEAMTALMGTAVFIDDYTSSIVVGSAMRPIADRFRVSREKLAFLVDGTSAPIAGLSVVSTWIAYEVGLFGEVAQSLGIERSGYALFFDALPYRSYCLLMLAFVFGHILLDVDLGPMRRARRRTLAQTESADVAATAGGLARCALIPLGGLLAFHVTALWWAGGGFQRVADGASALSWTTWRDTIGAVPSSSRVLMASSTVGLVLALLTGRLWGGLSCGAMHRAVGRGLRKGLVPATILTLAWSIKGCCDRLGTGDFLASLLVGTLDPVWFPALVFGVACLTSFATGTSYGTMAILIPTAIPVAHGLDGGQYGLITTISLGAVLDGAIFGDHCSPISDTTILSAMATGCDLMAHVRTQLPYGALVALAALSCVYLPGARGLSPALGFGLGCLGLAVVLGTFRRLNSRRK